MKTVARVFCPDCHAYFDVATKQLAPHDFYSWACPTCLEKRRKALIEIEARYPSAEQLGLDGPSADPKDICLAFQEGQRGRQRRVIRKSEPMGG